ncbi:MAG: GNAT family N-acetyltransferase [Coriobacteriia bacterium]|nr:GNAT family N-acetyltransferase [Coriobacteriia bacterium]
MQIREYNSETDKKQLLELSERLMDFEFPVRIDTDFLACIQRENFEMDLDKPEDGQIIFVATDKNVDAEVLLGFVQLKIEKGWISRQRHVHLERLAVSACVEGKGVAKALMAELERWTHFAGFPMVNLNVFATNERAINFYKHLGYEVETMKMAKEINAASGSAAAASVS